MLVLAMMFMGCLLSAQQEDRLRTLYTTLQRDILSLPLPERPPCPTLSGKAFDDIDKWLTEAARQREEGAIDCSFRLLAALQAAAAKDDTHRLAWLSEQTRTLARAEQIDSAVAVAYRLAELAEHTGGTQQGKAWLAAAQTVAEKRQLSQTQRLAEKALVFARGTHDQWLEARALEVIGNNARDIYMIRPDKSVPPLLEVLALSKAVGDTDMVVRLLGGISLHYSDTEPEQSLLYLEEAVATLRPETALRSRMAVIRTLSYFFQINGDFEHSNRLFEHSITIAKRLGLRSNVQNDYEQLASSYMVRGNATQAQLCLDSAYRYCNFRRELGYFYRSFAEVAAMRGDTSKALEWYQKAFQEQVKGYDNRNTQQLTEWETRFRTREKEIQLEEEKHQRWLLIGLVIALAAFLGGAVFAWLRQRASHRKITLQATQIERQAAELRRLDEAKSRFFDNVSHELRTPLTLIQGPLRQALGTKELPAQARYMLEMAQENSGRLLELVNQLLDLNRFETVPPELREEPTLLPVFLARITSEFQSAAEHRRVALQFESTVNDDLWVNADHDKLKKVLNNLLLNALKFTPAGGQIGVSLSVQNDRLQLRVSDTGTGIHPDDLPHIFERYYQSNRPGARVEGGFGIGLAYSRELAEIMGGRLRVESVERQGSTFELIWPLKRVAAPDFGEYPGFNPVGAKPGANTDPAAPHLLIVEDNINLQDYLRELLSPFYCLSLSVDGKAALEFLGSSAVLPDLIVSDVMMPVMDGFELLEALRKEPRLRDIPVLLLTARSESQDRLRAFRLGIDDYVQKPFDAEELLVRLENILRNHEVRMEWQQENAGWNAAESKAPAEDPWLAKAREYAFEHLGDMQFNVDFLARLLDMSRSTLNRRTREHTGLSANQFIQELRLQSARELLESGQGKSLKAVAEAVGIRSPHYLSRLYRERFGKMPGVF